MESREKGGVTGVTEEAGMSRGGGEGANRHWSPSYRTSWCRFCMNDVEDLHSRSYSCKYLTNCLLLS